MKPLEETLARGGQVITLPFGRCGDELLSDNTVQCYRRDITYFATWHALALRESMSYPVSVDVVLTFIRHHMVEGLPEPVTRELIRMGLRKEGTSLWRHSTIKRRLAAMAAAHHDRQVVNPVASPSVKQLLRRVRRHEVVTRPVVRREAITKNILKQMIENYGEERLIDIRDRALLTVAFGSGGRRRSELIAMRIEDLTPINGGYLISIPLSKTDQKAKGHQVPIKGEVARALEAWIEKAGLTTGPIFRGIKNNGELEKSLSPSGVWRIIKRRAKQAGIDASLLTPHSLRSGFVTECSKKNIAVGDVMAMTLHRSPESVVRYYRTDEIKNNPASEIL